MPEMGAGVLVVVDYFRRRSRLLHTVQSRVQSSVQTGTIDGVQATLATESLKIILPQVSNKKTEKIPCAAVLFFFLDEIRCPTTDQTNCLGAAIAPIFFCLSVVLLCFAFCVSYIIVLFTESS